MPNVDFLILVVIQLFSSVPSCPYRKDDLLLIQICKSRRVVYLVNELATLERVRTASGQKRCAGFVFSTDLQHFFECFCCFGEFGTVSHMVFNANILPSYDFFEPHGSCVSPTLSVSVAMQVSYWI